MTALAKESVTGTGSKTNGAKVRLFLVGKTTRPYFSLHKIFILTEFLLLLKSYVYNLFEFARLSAAKGWNLRNTKRRICIAKVKGGSLKQNANSFLPCPRNESFDVSTL